MSLFTSSYGKLIDIALATESRMDKKLFTRLTESTRQHAEIARGERAPGRVMTSRHDAPSTYNRATPSPGGLSTVISPSTKQQARELIDSLPDCATWEDVAYEVDLRASIERGLADADAGRLIPLEDLMKEFD
jgi:hypothetical protein